LRDSIRDDIANIQNVMHEQTSGDEEQKFDIADALFLVMSETLTFVDNVKRYPILYRKRINKEKTKISNSVELLETTLGTVETEGTCEIDNAAFENISSRPALMSASAFALIVATTGALLKSLLVFF
jgi:hypothetical protein